MLGTMRKFLCLALIAVSLTGAVTGCKSANKVAYSATVVTVDTVPAAVDLWNAYVTAGKASPAEKVRVDSAFDAYQASLAAERMAVVSYYTNKVGTVSDLNLLKQGVADSQAQLLSAIYQIVKAVKSK